MPRFVEKICTECKNKFLGQPSQRCCSRKCAFSLRRKETFARNSRPCETCGKVFAPDADRVNARFCSNECRKKQVRKTCPICKNDYFVKESHANDSIYCSRKCMNRDPDYKLKVKMAHVRSGRTVKVRCSYCKKEFYAKRRSVKRLSKSETRKRGRFCSIECYQLLQKKNRVVVSCKKCRKQLEISKTQARTFKYCSKECQKNRVYRICPSCGDKFEIKASRAANKVRCCGKCGKSAQFYRHYAIHLPEKVKIEQHITNLNSRLCHACNQLFDIRDNQNAWGNGWRCPHCGDTQSW